MSDQRYLSPEIRSFMEQNAHRELTILALEARKHPDLPMPFIIDQLYAKRKAKDKLPTWFQNAEVVYPKKISIEQCSSEQTAAFKASLVQGKRLIDLTGGFGVDDTFFAKQVTSVDYVEQQADLADIVAHNAQQMGITNLTCHQGDGIEFVKQLSEQVDWIYLDPARRDSQNKKLVSLADCQPNLLEIKDLLLEKGKTVLVKLSPMLDIKLAIRELGNVSKIWVVAVQNECKELLFQLDQESMEDTRISCINISTNGSRASFSSSLLEEESASVRLSFPQDYIYEPNVAILKGGVYKSIAEQFQLAKLHAHSHLYTSTELIPNFPGRTFTCKQQLKFNKKALLKALPERKANITVRNFPLTVAEIRKKTGIKDGGNQYVFATTDMEGNKLCLVCEKVI